MERKPRRDAWTLVAEFLERENEGGGDLDQWLREHPGREEELQRAYADWQKGVRGLDRLPSGSPQSARSLAPGKRVGDFALVAPLGRGGQATVWEAEQLSLGRRVALKLLPPGRLDDRAIGMLAREAQAGGRLRHPGLVAVYAFGESDGTHWIAQELVPGGRTLRHEIDDLRAAFDLPRDYYASVARKVAGLAEALHTAHEAGVIHRDVKPANVLVTAAGDCKITDFGLARIADESGLSISGAVLGTYLYMSPEQLSGRRGSVDRRTDVFSLGVTLYELLALRRPFEGDTSAQIAHNILYTEPVDLRRMRSRIPRDLAVICGKAMEKNRELRYATMGALAADLRRHLHNEPIEAKPQGALRRGQKWVRRHPTLATAIVLGCATLISTILFVDTNTARAAGALRLRAQQAREELPALRNRGSKYVRGSNSAEYGRWCRDYLRLYAKLGLPIHPNGDPDAFRTGLDRIKQIDPAAAKEVRSGLYDLAEKFAQFGGIDAWTVSQGREPPRNPRYGEDSWRSYVAEVTGYSEDHHDLVSLWPSLRELISRIERDGDLMVIWDVWADWWEKRVDRLVELDHLLDSPDANGLVRIAWLRSKINGHVDAIAAYEAAVLRDPTDFKAHFELASAYRAAANLGDLLEAQSFLDETINQYRMACVLDPSSAWAHTNLGEAYVQSWVVLNALPRPTEDAAENHRSSQLQNLVSRAIASYEKAIELNPAIAVAHSNLANVLVNDDPESAREHFIAALECEPCNEAAIRSYANFLARHAGDVQGARELYGQLIQCAPSSPRGYYLLGVFQRDLASAEIATDPAFALDWLRASEDALEQALALDPGHSDAARELGEVRAEMAPLGESP